MRNSSSSSNSGSQRERRDSCASNSSTGSGGGGGCNIPINKIFTVCDIVKTGHLHIKRPPTSGSVKIRIKTWQKRYIVLRDQSYHKGTACLEMYTTDTGWQEDKEPSQDCFNVDLNTVTHIDEYTDSKNYPHAFTITRKGHGPLIIGADSEYDLKEWMVAIQVLSDKLKSEPVMRNNNNTINKDATSSSSRRPSCPPRLVHWNSAQQLYDAAFSENNNGTDPGESGIRLLKIPNSSPVSPDCLVTVHPTDDSLNSELSGDYHMIILRDEIFLRKPGTIAEVISWQIPNILKFKSEDESDGSNMLTLEASSQSGKSAGKYLFRTLQGRKIIKKVKDVVAHQDSSDKSHDKELERLRPKPLCKMPSTPNLLSRGSPPKSSVRVDVHASSPPAGPSVVRSEATLDIVIPPEIPPEIPSRQRKISYVLAKPHGYLDLVEDGKVSTDDTEAPPPVPENKRTPKSSPVCPRRKLSKLPPLPPNAQDRSSPPKSNAIDIPPTRPPRKISRSPPPPPPRPQHTLGQHSLPI